MHTHETHHSQHHPRRQDREAALRWLASQLRWEHLLADLRRPTAGLPHDEEEAAA